MNIIKSVEIKHFRSFLGRPSSYALRVEKISHLNLFSGGNDAGKSNFLRALNLFFNNKINNTDTFLFERDFFLGKSDKTQKVIEISIEFDLSSQKLRDKFLPTKFKISKFFDRNGFRNCLYTFLLNGESVSIDSRSENNLKATNFFVSIAKNDTDKKNAERREWRYRAKFNGFLNVVSFEYIPAIRDSNYFSFLCGKVISHLKAKEDAKLEQLRREHAQIKDYQKTLKNKGTSTEFRNILNSPEKRASRIKEIDSELDEERKINNAIFSLEEQINVNANSLLKSIDFLEASFKVGKNLQDFFRGFDIGTGVDRNISFKSRGDGIQAKFIPRMLDFLSKISSQKYYIWGFEEPENSAEYKNQRILAKALKESFAKDKQIFLTTHSEEFLSLYGESESEVSLYHVYKGKSNEYGDYTQISWFDPLKKDFLFTATSLLAEELGTSYLYAKYAREIESMKNKHVQEKMKYEEELKKLKLKTDETVVFVEDSSHKMILERIVNLLELRASVLVAGSSDKVLNLSKEFNRPRYENFYFLVDGDCKTYPTEEIEKWHRNTLQLNKYCIENYLLTEDILSALQGRKGYEEVGWRRIIESCKNGRSGFAVIFKCIEQGCFNVGMLDDVDGSYVFQKSSSLFGFEKNIKMLEFCLERMANEGALLSTFGEIVSFLGKDQQ